jgi:hypothetical protein
MIVRLKLTLNQEEYSALMRNALADLRDPSDQARHILRQELFRRGWFSPLKPTESPAVDAALNPEIGD